MKHIERCKPSSGGDHSHRFFKHSLWLAGFGRGRHGGGRFSRGGESSGSDDDFSRGRKFSSDDLQLLLLALLADEPRHGYELIKMLESRSNGFYAPSPGMVYPALTYLEELGYTSVESEGNRKRYALTDAGKEYLGKNRERVDSIWARLNFFAQKIGMVRRALAGEDVEEIRGEHPPLKELMAARHRLKHLLMSRFAASSDEQLRVTKILERAVADIEAVDGADGPAGKAT